MASDVNPEAILDGFTHTLATLDEVVAYGRKRAPEIDRIYLVGCGAPNRIMLVLQYWIERLSPTLEVRRYFPAEFTTQAPPRLDARTLVLLGSKSGTTPETVAAAEYLSDKPCLTVAVTQTEDLPLARAVQTAFLMGDTAQSHNAMFVIMQALIGAILAERDGWNEFDALMTSLRALPRVIAETAAAFDPQAAEYARIYKDDRVIYHIASGPTFATAYVFGVCVLQEMQWMHSYPVEAAEFFHGPFEVVDQTTPIVLMLGEDASRPLMERVVRFCKKYTERLIIVDSQSFPMEGVAAASRAIVAPFVIEAALGRIAERLAVWHNQPLSTRRYMWKSEY